MYPVLKSEINYTLVGFVTIKLKWPPLDCDLNAGMGPEHSPASETEEKPDLQSGWHLKQNKSKIREQ